MTPEVTQKQDRGQPLRLDERIIERSLVAARYLRSVLAHIHATSERLFGTSAPKQPNRVLRLEGEDWQRFINTITNEHKMLGRQAGLSDGQQLWLINHLVSGELAGPRLYKLYVDQYLNEARTREYLVSVYANHTDPMAQLLKHIAEEYPLLGGVSADLYNSVRDPNSELNRTLRDAVPARPMRGWYTEVMANLAETWSLTNRLFGELRLRCYGSEKLLAYFLDDWKNDIQKLIVEAFQQTNLFSMGVLASLGAKGTSVSLFFWPAFPKPAGKRACEIEAEIDPLVFPQLRKRFGYLFNHEAYKQRDIYVPIHHSALDMLDYSKFLRDYLGMLNVAIEQTAQREAKTRNVLKLGNLCTVICHPRAVPGKHQARISINPESGPFCDFVMRVDRDSEQSLTFDCGNTSYEAAIELAHSMYEELATAPEPVDYTDVVDSEGVLKETAQLQAISLMRTNCSVSVGNRVATLAAMLAQSGSFLGTRFGRQVGHHVSEHINHRTSAADFEQIVDGFQGLLFRPM